jgi:hypothetical protein
MGANCQRCKRTKALREDYPPVLLNDPEGNAANKFPDNSVTTTKYTWYSFLPKNLIEQFRCGLFLWLCFDLFLSPLLPQVCEFPI